jgi:hypothetical protein
MPRVNCPPTYRFHKSRGCAVVTMDGRNRYLGPYGSPESHEAYLALLPNGISKASNATFSRLKSPWLKLR